MSEKYTLEQIRKSFSDKGYFLLTEFYVNNKQRLNYICPLGHSGRIAWNHWQEGHGCLKCVGINNSERFRMGINIVGESFEQEGYILLTSKYINAHQRLYYICPSGHKHSMTWNNWSKGYRCPTCDIFNRSGAGHWNWKGGISFEPYCEIWKDKEYKQSILERDDHRCQNPNCSGEFADKLCIHHIDYDKKNCHPGNLITLCVSCNSKANKDRDYWRVFYSKEVVING